MSEWSFSDVGKRDYVVEVSCVGKQTGDGNLLEGLLRVASRKGVASLVLAWAWQLASF